MAKKTAKKKAVKRAAAAETAAPAHVIEVPTSVQDVRACLAVAGDGSKPAEDRRQALQAVQAATFSMPGFDSVRADYVAALRTIARDDDHELRQRALGFLSRESDAPTQKALLEGLKDPAKALVAPEKALQLLSYDPHSGAYDAAREVLKQSTSEAAKSEAVRVLSSDTTAAPALEKLLSNKRESVALRRQSAAALHAVQPTKLQNWASKAVLDESEHQDIVATCLTAIEHFGDPAAVSKAKGLGARLESLQSSGPGKVKQLAKQVRTKYGL